MKLKSFSLILAFFVTYAAQAQSASAILHQLQKLGSGHKVLYIAAHPDDENTRLISWLNHAQKAEVAYLSLTRGSGGQNLIGDALGDPLGVIRTQELLSARRTDGANQYFTRARDFGYSKSASETLEKWNENDLLEDVVWVIRHYKPDVIITRFSPIENADRPTHGHHTASAMLAVKAFKLAADPKAYPNQLKTVKVWQPATLLWNTSSWFYGSKEKLEETLKKENRPFVKVAVEDYIPLLGQSCPEIAAASRTMHKSQGFGSSPAFGEQYEYLEYLEGTVIGDHIFGNIKSRYEGNTLTKKLKNDLDKIISQFNPNEPWLSVAKLLTVKAQFEQLEQEDSRFNSARISEIIQQCLGLKILANSTARFVARGDTLMITVMLRNPSDLNIQNISVELPDGSKHTLGDLKAKSFLQQEIKLAIADNAALTEPYWLQLEHSETTYAFINGLKTGETVVLPKINDLNLSAQINNQSIKFVTTIYHRANDPIKGEVEKPLAILPRVSLSFNNKVYLNRQGKNEITLLMHTYTAISKGFVELELPSGWQSEPKFISVNDLKKDQNYSYTFKITASADAINGKAKAMLKESLLITTTTVNEINFDHIPSGYWFELAQADLIASPIECKVKKVAYIEGAGDEVAKAIEQLTGSISLIAKEAILKTDLSGYDAIVLGIRTYNTLDNIDDVLAKLFVYTLNGGTVIVQYNTTANLHTKQNGPLPFKIGRDRVTIEEAPVKFYLPNHPVLNTPNKINTSHFEGWIQERGLYFASEWDKKYETPLSMNDPSEKEALGSLLILKEGKGMFVYTGLSFFRELPAGVSGAYVLFANILSLGK
jgi:LmbE family N-acetylglucosaminyl deacetylase